MPNTPCCTSNPARLQRVFFSKAYRNSSTCKLPGITPPGAASTAEQLSKVGSHAPLAIVMHAGKLRITAVIASAKSR